MSDDRQGESPRRDSGIGTIAAIVAAVLVLVCCAGPALYAAGVLGLLGIVFANPFVAAAVSVVIAAGVAQVWRRRSRHRYRSGRSNAARSDRPP
jgi:mercuric ion transport protein